MRPSALTQAARSALMRREAPPRHGRRAARPERPPRRVSGPMRGKAASGRTGGSAPRVAPAGRSAAVALPQHAPFRWKRSPKPAVRRRHPAGPTTERERTAQPPVALGRRIASFAVALPDHSWLDRVVRGRVWIPLLGVLLAGIVAAQVEILKLGANMGRALEETTTLTAQNEQLRGAVAQLADDQRIERLAGAMGLVLPPPGAVGYLVARPGADAPAAVGNIRDPNPAAFVAMTPSNGALVTGQGASTLPPTPGAPPAPAPATTSAAATPGPSASTTAATTASTTPAPVSTTPPAVTSQAPAATQGPAAQGPAATSPSAVPATGAAAIQPSGTAAPSGGG